MNSKAEIAVFVIYLAFMIGIGLFFFLRSKNAGEKEYFLGGRKMGPWVSALSAGASDMSAWVLMGLPTAIYAMGVGQVWISVGLALGYALSWVFEAPRLRAFSIVADDAITIPQYLTRRFRSKSYALQVTCAVIFLVAYTIYAASSVKAAGTLFHTVIGMDETVAMYLAAGIIIAYTFLGGFSAVCWTDFFQGLLMLGALLLAPVFAASHLTVNADQITAETPAFFNPFTSWQDIASGLGWGLGYFGMPHIIIRFMSVESQKSLKKSAAIGITWTTLILLFAALVGIFGREMLGFDAEINDKSLVFITMVRRIFPSVISGVLLSAILAASMSTADSQLLAAASAFSSDVYKPLVRNNKASDREMLWTGRMVVLIVAVVALVIASNPGAGTIMSLVSNAWGVFGAAFGPAILLSLFWKRFNFPGALAGIIVGALVDILWLAFLSGTGLYEIIPGFLCGGLAAVVTTLCTRKPSDEVEALFEKGISFQREAKQTKQEH
ncbi:MAG: sodium/proline symporter [Clostridia bacterium]|nr:sodium/proline symporter [Clostridia bacterium]